MAQLRRRESDVRDGTVHKIKDLEDQKFELEKLVQALQKEKAQISGEALEVRLLYTLFFFCSLDTVMLAFGIASHLRGSTNVVN